MSDLDEEDDISAEELAEASELARLLDGGELKTAKSEHFETAALLRAVQQPELEASREQELLEELLTRVPANKPRTSRGPRWLWLMVPAAAAVAVWQINPPGAPRGPDAVTKKAKELPAPSSQLLRLQAVALRGQKSDEYDRELNAYRGQVLALLSERYE